MIVRYDGQIWRLKEKPPYYSSEILTLEHNTCFTRVTARDLTRMNPWIKLMIKPKRDKNK